MQDSARARHQSRFWQLFAPLYDPFMALAARSYPRLIARLKSDIPGDCRVLEVASGTGIIGLQLAPHVAEVVGIDISPRMIGRAERKRRERRVNNASFIVEDAYQLGLAQNMFDTVICVNGLHLMHQPARPLAECGRVLKPGGQLLCATYLHAESRRARFFSKLIKLAGVRVANEFTLGSMASLIAGSGFVINRQEVLSDIMPLGYIAAVKPDRE